MPRNIDMVRWLLHAYPYQEERRVIFGEHVIRYGLEHTYNAAKALIENEKAKEAAKEAAAAGAGAVVGAVAQKAATKTGFHPLGGISTMQQSARSSFHDQLRTLNPYQR